MSIPKVEFCQVLPEIKQVVRLVLKALLDQVLLVADRVVKRVFVCVKFDLVVEIDELF